MGTCHDAFVRLQASPLRHSPVFSNGLMCNVCFLRISGDMPDFLEGVPVVSGEMSGLWFLVKCLFFEGWLISGELSGTFLAKCLLSGVRICERGRFESERINAGPLQIL